MNSISLYDIVSAMDLLQNLEVIEEDMGDCILDEWMQRNNITIDDIDESFDYYDT